MEYALGKLTAAIHVLTIHPGGIKERLLEAYDLHLSAIHPEDMPPELTREWKDLLKRMGKFGASMNPKGEVRTDAIQCTIPRVRKKTASQFAEDIDQFHTRLGSYIHYIKSEPAAAGQRR